MSAITRILCGGSFGPVLPTPMALSAQGGSATYHPSGALGRPLANTDRNATAGYRKRQGGHGGPSRSSTYTRCVPTGFFFGPAFSSGPNSCRTNTPGWEQTSCPSCMNLLLFWLLCCCCLPLQRAVVLVLSYVHMYAYDRPLTSSPSRWGWIHTKRHERSLWDLEVRTRGRHTGHRTASNLISVSHTVSLDYGLIIETEGLTWSTSSTPLQGDTLSSSNQVSPV